MYGSIILTAVVPGYENKKALRLLVRVNRVIYSKKHNCSAAAKETHLACTYLTVKNACVTKPACCRRTAVLTNYSVGFDRGSIQYPQHHPLEYISTYGTSTYLSLVHVLGDVDLAEHDIQLEVPLHLGQGCVGAQVRRGVNLAHSAI